MTAKAKETPERGINETISAFIAFTAQHGIDVDDRRDARLTLRLDDFENKGEKARTIRAAFRLWKEAGKDPERFRNVQIIFGNGDYFPAFKWISRNTSATT